MTLNKAKVAFTGKLCSMNHKEAYEVVAACQGTPVATVNRQTSILVVGSLGWPLHSDGTVSRKLERAEALKAGGHKVSIISEVAFLELAGLEERKRKLDRTYTAEDLCEIVEIHPKLLERWEQFGLIQSDEGFFGFRDLVAIQSLVELIDKGVSVVTVAKSMRRLSRWVDGIDQPLAQCKIIADNKKALLADFGEYHLNPDGQLQFNFQGRAALSDPVAIPNDATAKEYFERGVQLEDDECYEKARQAYEKAISVREHYPEAYFNLGNVHFELGQLDEAQQSYMKAVRQDPHLSGAWYNLGDIQLEAGKWIEAAHSFESALKADPDYLEAHVQLAGCYEKLGKKVKAAKHWQSSLELDPYGEWGSTAREMLGY